jgi:hypothetical protein
LISSVVGIDFIIRQTMNPHSHEEDYYSAETMSYLTSRSLSLSLELTSFLKVTSDVPYSIAN